MVTAAITPSVDEQSELATNGPRHGHDAHVVVLNDDHNTFEGVAHALATVLPATTLADGMVIAQRIHATGSTVVWSGVREVAELYWEQLAMRGLTLAPLQ